jgi:transcriptional regulator GlxA family with amidase domain
MRNPARKAGDRSERAVSIEAGVFAVASAGLAPGSDFFAATNASLLVAVSC